MITGLRAEAGLSECVREVPGCGDEMTYYFLAFALVFGAVALLAIVHLPMAFFAAWEVCTSRTGVGRGALWLLVILLVPVVGPVAWFRAAHRRRQRTPHATPDPDSDPGLDSAFAPGTPHSPPDWS